jgi:hypothetical protein
MSRGIRWIANEPARITAITATMSEIGRRNAKETIFIASLLEIGVTALAPGGEYSCHLGRRYLIARRVGSWPISPRHHWSRKCIMHKKEMRMLGKHLARHGDHPTLIWS